jgi:single-strand DNA-binding protein
LAEISNQYLAKGQQVYIEGRLQSRKWEGDDGKQRINVEIVAKELIILGERKKKSSESDRIENKDHSTENNIKLDSDLEEFPF